MSTTNAKLVQSYLGWMTGRHKSPATIYQYAALYGALIEELGTDPLSSTTTARLYEFLQRPRRGGIVASPATIKKEVMALRSLFRGLIHLDLLATDPAARLEAPTVHNEDPHPVSTEDWLAIWSLPLTDDERVALGFARFNGLRRAEVCGLNPAGFDGDRITSVVRKGGKRGGFPWRSTARYFEVKLPHLGASDFVESTERLLCARLRSRNLIPWGESRNPLKVTYEVHTAPWAGFVNPDQFNKRLVRLCTAAGLEPRAVTPHDLRHAFATDLVNQGVNITDVSRLLGHADIQVTMRYIQAKEDPLGDLLADDKKETGLATPNRWA